VPIEENSRVSESDWLALEVGRSSCPRRSRATLAFRLMHASTPHFVLFSGAADAAGHWQFVLQPVGGEACLSVTDVEPDTRPSRLELLAVVRGLEALDGPSRVTLFTKSRYVSRGISRGIGQWRERRWRWERFGQLVPIRDYDLWQRVDRAMRFHQVECGWSGDDFPATLASRQRAADSALQSGNDEMALLVVPRAIRRRRTPRPIFAETFDRWRRSIVAGLAAIRRPAFTRAA
jgi:ribonuclease HI